MCRSLLVDANSIDARDRSFGVLMSGALKDVTLEENAAPVSPAAPPRVASTPSEARHAPAARTCRPRSSLSVVPAVVVSCHHARRRRRLARAPRRRDVVCLSSPSSRPSTRTRPTSCCGSRLWMRASSRCAFLYFLRSPHESPRCLLGHMLRCLLRPGGVDRRREQRFDAPTGGPPVTNRRGWEDK